MAEYLKTVVTSLFLVIFILDGSDQQPVDYKEYLKEKFLKYCETVPREEIFVHTDREDYIAGEDLWFNIYLADRQSNRPSANSKIAYFEVLNPENRPVLQKRVRLDHGVGPGQVILPDTLTSGSYTLRVYTNWMKNFLPDNCFMKDINIYNALRTNTWLRKSIPVNQTDSDNEHKTDNIGITLKVNNLRTDTLEIFVSASREYFYNKGNIIYLFIQTHGIINHISSEKIREENLKISVPKKELIPGINHITLFDSEGKPLREKFIYTPEKKPVSPVIESNETYNLRQKVILEITPDSALNGSDISISVAPITRKTGMTDISDYMIFGSEFGMLPWRSIINKRIDELSSSLLDSILSTAKSSWIDWSTILSDKIPDYRYRIENEDHYLYGKLINSQTQTAEPGKLLFLSVPGKEAVFQYAMTDSEGKYCFHIPIDIGEKDIVIQPEETKNTAIEIESAFSKKYTGSEVVKETSANYFPAGISKLSVNYQVKKIYGTSAQGDPYKIGISPVESERFYGKPDIELLMKDYIVLPVMEEVFFELLPGVFLKNRKSGYEISILDPVTNEIYYKQPLLMIDGVIINDPSVIAGLDPEVVEQIDVIKDKYVVGDCLFYGIINIITKAGNCKNITLPDYAIRGTPRVYDQVISFSSPAFTSPESKQNRIPDFRNTLYWNPSVQPDKNGKYQVEFWSSDFASDYVINVQGVADDGRSVSFRKFIKVE